MSTSPSSPPSAAAEAAPLVSAPFWRRLAALAIDVLVLAALLVIVILGANAAAGHPALSTFWQKPRPVHVSSETASRTVTPEADGVLRELVTRRETRLFADGAVRIFAVLDARVTRPGGHVETSSTETLIGISAAAQHRRIATGLLGLVLALGYFAAFEASALSGSLGKRALGLRVVDLAGRRLSPGLSLWRQALKCLDVASSGLTYLIAAFTPRGQAFHDILAGTVVVVAVPPRQRVLEMPAAAC